MSESPSNVTNNNNLSSNIESSKSETAPDNRKLSLSQSENSLDNQKTIRHKLLGKVKSWSSKDQYPKDKCISVELDLARSLSKLEVTESNEDIGSNLLKARDSLDSLLKDEQNMPKSSLEKSILHHKPRSMPDSPKSSPQLGENRNASPSRIPFWDSFDRQGKKHRKELKKKGKNKHSDSPRNEGRSMPLEGKKPSIMKRGYDGECKETEESGRNDDNSVMEEENVYKYKYLPKNSKSVVFTNEVLVVYFNSEDVVGEEKEPLKKEIEQQVRNKEMRRIHLNKSQEKHNLCLF